MELQSILLGFDLLGKGERDKQLNLVFYKIKNSRYPFPIYRIIYPYSLDKNSSIQEQAVSGLCFINCHKR